MTSFDIGKGVEYEFCNVVIGQEEFNKSLGLEALECEATPDTLAKHLVLGVSVFVEEQGV